MNRTLFVVLGMLIQTAMSFGAFKSLFYGDITYDDRFCIRQPLQNSTFNHWKAAGSAIFLEDKIMMAPELRNQHGLIYNKNVFTLKDFSFEVDVSLHNKKQSSFAKGNFMIYLLRDNPMKGHSEFANSLDGQFDGILLKVDESAVKNDDEAKDAPKRLHEIRAYIQDENYNPAVGLDAITSCTKYFEDQTILLRIMNNTLEVSLIDAGKAKETRKSCMKVDLPKNYFSEDHDTYIFMAANTGEKIPNEHVIHEARFIDIKHLHDILNQDSSQDRKAFSGKAQDVIRRGVVQSHDQYTIDAYNTQLIKHNKLYSQMASEFITNSEAMVQSLHKLPAAAVMANLTTQAENINSKFGLINNQFDQYEKDIKNYKEYLQKKVGDRDTQRHEGSTESSGSQEQNAIIGGIKQIMAKISTYADSIEKNHLIEEIQSYDRKVKEMDQALLAQDSSLITNSAKKLGHNEHLTDGEMKNIFKQQIRKIMTKNVKTLEKSISRNQSLGVMGEINNAMVDYAMYFSIVFVVIFGIMAYRKLAEQKDHLVI